MLPRVCYIFAVRHKSHGGRYGLKLPTCYCLCDDFLISEGWRDDRQCTMSTAEVMTAALTAAAFFSGSYEKKAACFLSGMDICLPCFQKASSAAA